MRNLSYHVHKEVPGADKYQELDAGQTAGTGGSQKKKKDDAGCFGGKKAKGMSHREPKTGSELGINCAVQFCSCKPFCNARVVQFAEVRVVVLWHAVISLAVLLLSVWDLCPQLLRFCLALNRSDACCCNVLLLDNGGCALLSFSWLCSCICQIYAYSCLAAEHVLLSLEARPACFHLHAWESCLCSMPSVSHVKTNWKAVLSPATRR